MVEQVIPGIVAVLVLEVGSTKADFASESHDAGSEASSAVTDNPGHNPVRRMNVVGEAAGMESVSCHITAVNEASIVNPAKADIHESASIIEGGVNDHTAVFIFVVMSTDGWQTHEAGMQAISVVVLNFTSIPIYRDMGNISFMSLAITDEDQVHMVHHSLTDHTAGRDPACSGVNGCLVDPVLNTDNEMMISHSINVVGQIQGRSDKLVEHVGGHELSVGVVANRKVPGEHHPEI